MAITTLSGAVSGEKAPYDYFKGATGSIVATRPHSLIYVAGNPAAAAAPTPGIGGTTLTSYAGQLPFNNPSSGNTYLHKFSCDNITPGVLMLCDRLWHNSGIDVTSTSEQTFTSSVDIPSRDMNGAALGHGVFAAVEVSSNLGSGIATLTLKYNNQDNTEKTATNIRTMNASSIAGTFYSIGLAAGDTGVRRAVSLTLSVSLVSGAISVVLYRVLACLGVGSYPAIYKTIDQPQQNLCCLTSGFPRAYDNTVPFLVFFPVQTTSSNFLGTIQWTQG